MKSAGQVVLFAVILSFLESVTAEVKNKDHLEPINESAQHGESARWPLSGHNQGSVGTFGDLATEMQKDKQLSEYVSSLRLVGEHLQRLTGKIVALDVHLLNYRRKGQETSEPFKRVLGFINGQSREMDGEDISTSNRMVLLSGYIGIVRTITSRAVKIVHNLNSLGATLRELERTIDDFDEILPPEGLQLSLGGALELLMTDTYQCPEFHHVETPDIPEMQQENVNVTLLDFAIVAEHSDRVSRITQEARDIIEEVKYIKNIISYSSTLLHDIDGTVVTERNVALNKEASQSSLLRSGYPAERAVDGNTGTVLYPRQECTHTDLEYEPWWKVDLGDTYVISHVTIINRWDCCGERLQNFSVRVGPHQDISRNTQCGETYTKTPSDGETIDILCVEPIVGKWVSVQLLGREDYLSLCEVEVYAKTRPEFEKYHYDVYLRKNVTVGTLLIDLNATNIDEGIGGGLVHSFRNDTSNSVRELFSIDRETGRLTVKSPLDAPYIIDVYGIVIQVEDTSSNTFPTFVTVNIHIDDGPRIAMNFLSTVEGAMALRENSPINTVIAHLKLSASDRRQNGTIRVELQDSDGSFALNQISDDQYTIVTSSHLDREEMSSYIITVVAEDTGVPPLSSYESFPVILLDVNDNSPDFGADQFVFSLLENSPIGTIVGTVTASDLDEGQNADIAYYLEDNNELIDVDPDGNIVLLQVIDREAVSVLEFMIEARDNGIPFQHASVRVVITVIDQNDNPPRFTQNDFVFSVTRPVPVGALVGRVLALDPDEGRNAEMSYRIRNGNGERKFTINSGNGTIYTLMELNTNETKEYEIAVTASDGLHETNCIVKVLVKGEQNFTESETIAGIRLSGEVEKLVDDTSVTKSCQEHQFSCSNGKCLPPNWRCDGDQDCPGGEDEESCGQRTCTSDEFECTYDLNCISVSSRCNNVRDCDDGSDEEDCENFPCKSNQLRCGNTTQCISIDWRCDADDDCDDGSDEKNCGGTMCQSDEFQCSTNDSCISRHWRCDGELDCRDGSDEENCTRITCGPGQFQCSADKKCIQTAWRCDGDPDCVDGTDEDGCEGTDEPACSEREFQCISGSCIHVTWRCDNDRDCPDGSDELNCDGEAAVTCSPDQFQCSSDKKCVHGAWRCDGESDCDDDSDEEGCEGTVENPDCGEAGFRCSSGRCIHAEWRCDKEKDCPDGSDELNCNEVTEPPDQGSVNRSQERWREDLRCGPDFPAPGASQGECDPASCFPCCSLYGYCGNTDDHCLCDGCVNYGTVYGVEYRSGWIGLKGDDLLSVKWTEEGRCGPGVSAPGAEVAECNPHSCNPCCSPWGWCGNTEDHCDCYDCVDYRTHGIIGNRWREDGRCGPEFPAPGTDPGECDPISLFPCCSAAGECGRTAAHCKCDGCIDFRNGTGTVAVSPSPPVDREYMGCYKDSKKRRLPKGPKISQEMTTDLCIEHCRDEGYIYAGTQYYEECWCGNERHFSRIGRQRKNKQCSTPCRGNEDEKCGGPWRLAVYKVGKKIKKKDESKKEEVNVALNKEASQSSLLRSEYPAERAVDGNTGTVLYPRQECTHTDLEYEPWWKVDLGDTYVISHVTVVNRGDCCGERLRNFMVRVGPFEDLREDTPCGDIYSETPSDGETIDVRCAEPISGRWVSVQLIGREDYLSLCEVQVYAVAGQVAKRKWRDDWHCGPGYSAEGADPAECDPTSCFPCCSAAGWCGNTEDHCDCPGCTNFQEIYGTPLIVKEETIAAPNRRWRDDFRCGPDFPAPGADPGECDPHSCFPCCSASGHCGNVWPEHCNCPGCVDYRFHNQNGSRWRDDLRCGPDFPAPGAASGECDPVSFTPCCSLSGFCGSTEEHCKCEGCVDFRTGLKENQIHPTSTTDEDSRPYLLFSSRQKIRKLYPDSSAPPEVMQTPDKESVVGLDFHWQKQMLFYTDVPTNAIYRMYLNDTERSEVVVDVNLVSSETVAVDWIGDNLFWTNSGPGKAVIEMANLDGSYRKTFLREGVERPRGLAVDPVNGYLFYSDWGEMAKIERVTLDGKDRKFLVSYDIRWPNSIALDVAQGRLFWTDSGMDRIESISTDGNNRKKLVEMEMAPHSYGITVFEDKIFWTDWSLNGVYSADKSTGRNPTVVYEHGSESDIFDIKMVDKDRQQGTSPCAINNGGCSHFCLNTPTGHTCACPDRPKIDRKYCRASAGKSGSQPSPTEAHHRMNRSDMAKVEGYSPRRGDCPGNDIWSIYRDNTSLEDCAELCSSHSDCVSFMFYNNHRCYPKTKTCAETTKTNPRNVFYDRIIDDDPLECLTDSEGTTYRGRVRLTKSGRTCQRWDSSSPHKHKYLQKYPYHGLEEDFCRNPDGRPDAERPWCYTTDLHVRWEYCDIPECGNSSRECIDDSTYNGKVQVTLSGRTCQRWDSETPHVPKIRSPLPGLNENYCRNLPELGEHNWPWCYTIDPDIPWEYCRIQSCVTDVLEAVGGYAPRHGDCPGNDIWSIYEDYVTLEECAQMCTNHPDCVSFMFYDNHRCYPKKKTCAETIKSNPRNVFYDRIIEKETKRKWREDYHCGFGYSAEGSDPAECHPHSCFSCCSAAGWCGNTPDHCDCPGCTDYQKEYGVAPIKSIDPGPDDSRRWRDDYRCGPDFPAPGADPGECDPHSCFPCCSSAGHCGNIGVEHCDCPGCVDYRYHNQNGSRWRDDLRCGPDFPAPGAASGECDPVSFTPCCSLSGFCGSTEEHCTCEGCVDFRTGSGVKEVSPTTTVEPLECLTDSEGTSYRGTRQYTKSGLTCQRWDSTFPHENKYLEKYPNRGLDENFCRNPDGRPDAERPWCYTIDADVRWEYCDIPDCEDVDATDCELTLEEQAVGCKASDSAQMCSGHGQCVCGQCECWHILPMAMEKYSGQFCECNNLSCDRYMGEICGGHGVCQCGKCDCEEGWTGAACHCSESVDNCLSSNGLICNNHGLCQCGVCRCDPYNIYYGPQCDDCATCPGKCEALRECGEFLTGGRKDFMEVCSGVKVVKAQDINTDSSKLCRFMTTADREFEFTYQYDSDDGVVIRYNLVPSIVHPPVDTTGVDGGIVSLSCEANVKLPIVWTKGGSKINARARNRYDVVEYQDGRASVLRIDPLRSPRDEDTFTCRMESAEYGTVEEASVSINVLAEENLPDGFPTITQGPQLKAVERGRPAILVCSASGDPAPDITWLKDMVPVDMTDTRIKLLSSGSLQINSTIQEDEGRYECVANNNLGTRYSNPANLYIRVRRVPPRFNIIPDDVEVNLGDNINLTCAAIGSPVPFVQWLKDNKDLSDKTAQSGRNILRLENVVESANYTCFASSPLGVIEHTVLVTVKDALAMVDGYTARRGDCPGNDIWAIYTRSTTLEECARMCTRHPRCVTFMFFDNQECYPKSKSCDETTKTNPKNVFYDKIAEDGADGSVDSQPAAALQSEPKWLSFPPPPLGRYAGRLRSLETESTEAETKSEVSGIVRKIFGLPIFRKRRHVVAQQDDSSSDSFLAIGGKTYRFPSQPQERYAVAELSTLPYDINRFLEVLVHLRQCTLTDGQEQQGMASTKEQKYN